MDQFPDGPLDVFKDVPDDAFKDLPWDVLPPKDVRDVPPDPGGTWLSCGEALECALAKSVPPAMSVAGCMDLTRGPSREAFTALIDCAESVCGPMDGWGGYGCAVTEAFQGNCQELYRVCVDDCRPDCAGRHCGPDGCGGVCGECMGCDGPDSSLCTDDSWCRQVCCPSCNSRECGPDGCGGICGVCPVNWTCTVIGRCETGCMPRCEGRMCGPDGCGGICGKCPPGWTCTDIGRCEPGCVPSCANRECGGDGCGGSCGTCREGFSCMQGRCVQGCVPRCDGRMCGPDGCGGICGQCPSGWTCTATGTCTQATLDGCTSRNGPGCGGCPCESCVCSRDPYCCKVAWDDYCVDLCWRCGGCENVCIPDCTFEDGRRKECGSDGCGGSCGYCVAGSICESGLCRQSCVPSCAGKECGNDGCGGSCGTCPSGSVCDAQSFCSSANSRTCLDAYACVTVCQGSLEACAKECTQGLSQSSVQIFMRLAECVVRVCGYQPSQECLFKASSSMCQQPYQACALDKG